jgi:hypothetical protein
VSRTFPPFPAITTLNKAEIFGTGNDAPDSGSDSEPESGVRLGAMPNFCREISKIFGNFKKNSEAENLSGNEKPKKPKNRKARKQAPEAKAKNYENPNFNIIFCSFGDQKEEDPKNEFSCAGFSLFPYHLRCAHR